MSHLNGKAWIITQRILPTFWSYTTNIVRVCVMLVSLITSELHVTSKSNHQICFGSTTKTNFLELLCHHFFTSTDPSVTNYFHVILRFRSHFLEEIVLLNQLNQSILPSLHFVTKVRLFSLIQRYIL